MGLSPGTGSARQYAGTMAGFWSGLASTLRGLETLADGRSLDGGSIESLRLLQYRLHWSSEALAGVEPPPGAEESHAELAEALTGARDTTGEVAEAVEVSGPGGVERLLFEWRGALFRVRLARMRLTPQAVAEPAPDLPTSVVAATSTALTLLGVAAFAVGAVMTLWPLWAAGLVLVAAGVLAYRP